MINQGQQVWIPDENACFVQGQFLAKNKIKNKQNVIEEVGTIRTGAQELDLPMDLISPANPSTFDKIDDMSELTFLNEASVLFNLENRYAEDNIYTYSGLFLVAINPYSNLRIYTSEYVRLYHGSPKEDNKPHIFAVAEEAYQNLLTNKTDQSILVTGESGAGKTENTKKILQYLASVTTNDKFEPVENHESFERKILQSNPILESFGNAQTVRNNNSSRFGKFIKIEFDELGKINGAHIDWYLLEKSRVIHQNSKERNYHIFYQMLAGLSPQELRKLKLDSNSVKDYRYLRESNARIPGIDDAQDFKNLMSAFEIVGFSPAEIDAIFRCISIILQLGNVDFVSEKAEQAIIKGSLDPLCELMNVKASDFQTAVLKPRSKAGKEWVYQVKNASQARTIIDSLSRTLYEKLFAYIVRKINASLDHGSMTENFIGLLDIAGFEIFKNNSFEQLCINYTNEKLQQFFNHHMFVLEQSEYLKENIQWSFVDYGKDLQSTIDLIEQKGKSPGVLPLLDEESILPKSTDESFYSKLITFCDNGSSKFKRSKTNSCFVLRHYAGDVEYNISGWLNKNKDPLSDNMLQVLSSSTNGLFEEFFNSDAEKVSPFKTASHKHREQLSSLLQRLSSTEPHFVRCIIPNNKKKARDFDRRLILEQLRCNGVLEGIRIAREGYPNRIFFKEFFQRYKLLAGFSRFGNNSKKNCETLLSSISLDPSLYKVGNSKLFFKAGVLAGLELRKEEIISEISTSFKAHVSGMIIRRKLNQQLQKLRAAQVIAIALRSHTELLKDDWYNIFIRIKPLLSTSNEMIRSKKIAAQMKSAEAALEKLELENTSLVDEKKKLDSELLKYKDKLSAECKNLEETSIALKSAKSRESELIRQLDLLKKESENFAKDKEEIHAKHSETSLELEKLRNDISEHQSSMRDLENSRKEVLSRSKVMEKELGRAREEQSSFALERKTLEQEITSLKSVIAQRESEIEGLKGKLNANDEEIENSLNSLESKFLSTSKRLEALVEENKDLKDQISGLKKSLLDSQNSTKTKEEQVSNLSQKLQDLNGLIASINNEKDSLSEEYNNIVAQLRDSRKELSEYKTRCRETEDEIKNLRSRKAEEVAESNVSAPIEKALASKLRTLEDQLKNERALINFFNDRWMEHKAGTTVSKEAIAPFDQNEQFDVPSSDEWKNLKLQLRKLSTDLENECEHKKETISRLRFTETRLASASFEIQTLSAQLKRLKDFLRRSNSDAEIEKLLDEIEPVKFNHEKLILEIEYLKSQLKTEAQARRDAENAATALHGKVKRIHRSDSSSDIYRLKFEASEERVRMLESKLHSTPLREKPNFNNGEIFTKRMSISKYEEDLKFHKLENFKLQEVLLATQKGASLLKREMRQLQIRETCLLEQIDRLENDLSSTEKQNEVLVTSAKGHKAQYDRCASDLLETQAQLRDVLHNLKQSEGDLKNMSEIIDRLKQQNKQKDKEVWEKDAYCSDLEFQLEDRKIDLNRVKKMNEVLKSDLDHFKDRLRNARESESSSVELDQLQEQLSISMKKETALNKEISSLKYSLETLKADSSSKIDDLLVQKKHYEDLVETLGRERDAALLVHNEAQGKIKSLLTQADSFSEQITQLSSEKEALGTQIEDFAQKLTTLQNSRQKTFEENDNFKAEIKSLKEALELQRQQNHRDGTLFEQLQTDATFVKSQLGEEKTQAIALREENVTLSKLNEQLLNEKAKLEAKLADQSEKDAWISRLHELENLLGNEADEKSELLKNNKGMERTLADLKATNERQAKIIGTATKDKEYFVTEITKSNEQISSLERHASQQEVKLSMLERDNVYYKERVSEIEREIDLWKQKYNDLSDRRRSVNAKSYEEVFV
ncbi:LAMI_0D03202g1_1 [Lachancea mirantina]|uniref:LAMI_0D03202g1_1 n=1 Tax=Lachancea mirantina TaxID=1230905 RepID=A0A1G4JA58_9SACH|nr:LAMI_0D03202g1_1 [Lachancea mirantina]